MDKTRAKKANKAAARLLGRARGEREVNISRMPKIYLPASKSWQNLEPGFSQPKKGMHHLPTIHFSQKRTTGGTPLLKRRSEKH